MTAPDERAPMAARACIVHAPAEHGPFRHPLNAASEVYGTLLGRTVGLARTGVNLARLPPGKESFVFHAHHVEEEWLFVLAGTGTLEIGDERFEVGPGDFAGFPPRTFAHHLRNDGPGDLAYLTGGENREVEVGDFPRLGRRLVRLSSEATTYPLGAGSPLVPMPAAAPTALSPRDLLVRRGDLSPGAESTFRHPLNPRSETRWHGLAERARLARVAVNLVCLGSGKESYVFHRHAVEEEWVYVLRGRIVAEIGEERFELGAGDFAGFTPRAPAHLVANPYAEEASYLEGGEIVSVDVVDMPRLGRRMVRVGEERTLYPASAGETYVPVVTRGG